MGGGGRDRRALALELLAGGRDAIGTGPGELLADPGPLLELLLASIDELLELLLAVFVSRFDKQRPSLVELVIDGRARGR